ncbi:MAG: AI-2E family transporter [Betaproteobacteria bacterium]|nr:AI-2E family transporter [Betaproteobacteria bacterium]
MSLQEPADGAAAEVAPADATVVTPDIAFGPALRWLLLAVTLALAWVLQPFAGAILWGAIVALLFAPWNRWLLPRVGRRRSLAAGLTLLLVVVVVVLPLLLLLAGLGNEVATLYERVQSNELRPTQYFREIFGALPHWVRELLDRFGLVNFTALQRWLNALLLQGSRILGSQAFGIGQNTLDFVLSVCIALYLAFFLMRDGEGLVRLLRRAVPLAPQHTRELVDKFSTVIRATVRSFVVAAIQGALGGLAFWVLDIGAVLLWTALMTFLSLLPAVGAALVWAPVAIYLLVTGALWQGWALIAWGVLIIGLADNVLRPMLVGRDTRLPDWLVLLSTLGGMAVMGFNGFVLGPVVAAMFVAVWHIHLARADQP